MGSREGVRMGRNSIFFALLGVLLLFYSRIDVLALPLFVAVFFLMVFQNYREKDVFGLVAIAAVASLVLALRFRYLTWGDPWSEYAMILRLIEYGSLAKEVYPSQQPAMHLSIAAAALITEANAMALQKFVVPLFSTLSIVILYKFVKAYFGDKELGLLAGILLLVGTPYLHWTTQAVRESMGIPMLLMAFYFSYKAVKSAELSDLLVSIILISGLILTHNFSAAIFTIAWLGFSIAYVYVHGGTKTIPPSIAITIFTIVASLVWWSFTGGPIGDFVNALNVFLPGNPLVALGISVVMLYALPYLFPKAISRLRAAMDGVLKNKVMQGLIIFTALSSSLVAVNLVSGKSFLVLNYPVTMMFNGAAMILLSLVGLYFFLNLRGIPILAWTAALALPLILSTLRILPFGDPLRFMEFLYIPLAIIAGSGLKLILAKISWQGARAGTVAVLATISLITAFPAVVFWGTHFEKGNVLYDDRSWAVYHPASEIKTVEWLNELEIKGIIYADNYVYYAAQWIKGDIFLENRIRLGSEIRGGNNYFILTERMQKYAEFSEGIVRGRYPLSDEEVENLDEGGSLIYDAGSAKVYYIRR